MSYVYKITNQVNGKVYIGQTSQSLEERFRQHCKDARRDNFSNRPLYSAIRKYGSANFFIELIEETDIPNEREQYWIEYYNSYHNGYNATFGGEGTILVDRAKVLALFQQGKMIKEIAKILNCDAGTCRKILTQFGISHEERKQRAVLASGKQVDQIEQITGKILNTYPSLSEASRAVTGTSAGMRHISEVCHGKRTIAYGYGWQFS